MADTAVAITAGSGTNIDTRTESTNSNHRQVVVLGDPTANASVAAVMAASTAPVATDPALVVTISPNTQNANGQATMANSTPVAVASDQSALPVGGFVAHDAADSGNPVKQGFKATSSLSALTLVATADRTDGFAGIDGVQIVRTDTNLEDITVNFISCTSGANTSALTAPSSGIKWYIKGVMIYNNGASNGALLLTDGSGGSTKAKVPFPASTGTVVTFALPVAFTAATAVYADPTGSDTIDVTIFGFKSKV